MLELVTAFSVLKWKTLIQIVFAYRKEGMLLLNILRFDILGSHLKIIIAFTLVPPQIGKHFTLPMSYIKYLFTV